MSIIKKIIAATTSVLSVGAFSLASITAYADETTTTTTEAAVETTETETTTSETSTETSSDTTTSTTAPASYNMWLSCNGNIEQENAVTVNANGTYTVKYKFTEADLASGITPLILESDINSEIAADVKFKVTGIKLGVDEATAATIQYVNLNNDNVFGTNTESKCYYLNIIKGQNTNTDVVTTTITEETTDLNTFTTTAESADTSTNENENIGDLVVDTVQFAPKADDTVFVTFTVEGLANADPATTTTTTTRTISYVGYGNNGGSSNGKTTTNTVAQTADEGVVAIVVAAAAAVALAAGAMTIRKKRK